MERIIELKQRGLTPRNISSQRNSRIIQVAAQHQSNNDKRRHIMISSLDEHIEEREYASETKERLRESIDGECTSNRIIDLDGLRGGVASTLCRPCVESHINTQSGARARRRGRCLCKQTAPVHGTTLVCLETAGRASAYKHSHRDRRTECAVRVSLSYGARRGGGGGTREAQSARHAF